ncbi:hypothetical protein P170DRAFT_355320 [Aspergillus steynii IBT 23096]|uniref:Peptidase M20 domain-containing protein 2 n=1 Tax=Aspergillus steynii IBT 23096 TaxID=1392250 RepID=A0A2I2GEC2_9EURO|nr:uncharacterized protein P170DRAFT_355320 [Aspergillus steynii IBT 23096]PLB51234.1 hypothetical protein P170DRAFT_355320 [Aspergillus steynii IBT 23096]
MECNRVMDEYIASLGQRLRNLNKSIHDNPELAYEEHHAHETVCTFLEEHTTIPVTRRSYGLATAFEAISGSSGRCVNFNAEYDALPGIGHACGHNLIATAGVAAFLALSHLIERFGISGRAHLLGTPAEEDGGGKIDLLKAGAYDKADVSLMIHPMSDGSLHELGIAGVAGQTSISCFDLICTYEGVSAHASANPWDGVNALDAIVCAYNNISMLRQQIKPEERIHGAIMEAPKITNAIPERTVTKYTVRSPSMKNTVALGERVRACLQAGALATGCKLHIEETEIYADLRVNEPLCGEFAKCMKEQGEQVQDVASSPIPGSTDQGNVSYALPALHANIGIPVSSGAQPHTHDFCTAAGRLEAHEIILKAAKAMAMTGWALLTDNSLYGEVRDAFDRDCQLR